MKINILHELKDGAWGGGNQFLKALRDQFSKIGIYENDPDLADVLLFNSFPFGEEYLFRQIKKLKNNKKILIHRIDGPIFAVRGRDMIIDRIIFEMNDIFASGTIFQSGWSKQKNIEIGMKNKMYEATIINAPDSLIFNKKNKESFSSNRKTRLIATSWSNNMRKGFNIYKYLDENLDFSRYEMTFIGNSPIEFSNIKHIEPLSSKELSVELKKHDIFITASQSDPCSNSLIEAIHCGLPGVVLNDGGHPELIKLGGEIFNKKEEIISKIEKITNNYSYYLNRINPISIDEISKQYLAFFEKIYNLEKSKIIAGKKENLRFYKMLMSVYKNNIYLSVRGGMSKVWKKIKI